MADVEHQTDENDWQGPERREDDRRAANDRRANHGFTLRMIHELAQRFEQLSLEGRERVVEYAKTLLVDEMADGEDQAKDSSLD